MNARSILNKSSDLESVIVTYKPDVLVITETWLQSDVNDEEVTPRGYGIYRKDRDSRGGGVAIIYREYFHVTRLADIPGIECVIIKLQLDELSLLIGGFYRPPSAKPDFCDKLNEFLCAYKANSRNLILTGDFNIPSINWCTDFPEPLTTDAERFVDVLLFHDLTQLVKEPTRVHGDTKSILDLFLVSNGVRTRDPEVHVLDGISDHNMISLAIPLDQRPKSTKKSCLVPVFTQASDVDILDVLDESFSEFIFLSETGMCSVDDLWRFFKNLVFKCMKDYVPTRLKVTKAENAWTTREVVRLRRKAKKIRKRYTQCPSAENMSRLADLRAQLSDSIQRAKEHYYGVSMKNFLLSSPAKFWRHFSKRKSTLFSVDINNETITDKTTIAESFNTFFTSVFTRDDGKKPRFDVLDSIPPIGGIEISEQGILALLLKIDVKKTPGIDGIPNTFLVRYAEWCSKYLCIIFNKSLTASELPIHWKFSKIVPIPKTNNTSSIPCYRPISLLCTCAKIFEHIIFKHISLFLENHKIISACQHGFRKGLSTTTQLLETVHDFAAVLDKQGQTDIIFLDFEKAFDRVSHQKLLLKLQSILKNDLLLSWVEAYLSHRCQSVDIEGVRSSPQPVQSGIPQGSVLGPLFFLIFINDIADALPVKIRLFADDCVLYQEVHSPADQALLNASLESIFQWCETWQMKINILKTVAMTITRKREPLKFTYCIKDHVLTSVDQFKYLGVIISSDLKWNQHIAYIQKKAMRSLGYLRRTLRKSTQEIKLLAYKTYVRPILEYASTVWDPYTKLNITKLENIQRKAIRFVYASYSWRISPSVLLEKAQLTKLEQRRYYERQKYMYLLYHDKLGISRDGYIEPVIRRSTRSLHSKKLKEFSCKTDNFKNSFFPRSVREWNRLKADVVECRTVESFMNALKK